MIADSPAPESIPGAPLRLDQALVRRGLARSRGAAAQFITAGQVLVDGKVVTKLAQPIRAQQQLKVTAEGQHYVGRGALKLLALLDECSEIQVENRRCLDVGASTGGFTQVLLERRAEKVIALDVGRGQLAELIRQDPRVVELSQTSIRGLAVQLLDGPVQLILADLSFISLTTVMPDLARVADPGTDLILLIKPQFEIGRRELGSRGIVRSVAARRRAVAQVCQAAHAHGLQIQAVRQCHWPGTGGNVEYFLWASRPDSRSRPGPVEWAEPGLSDAIVRLISR